MKLWSQLRKSEESLIFLELEQRKEGFKKLCLNNLQKIRKFKHFENLDCVITLNFDGVFNRPVNKDTSFLIALAYDTLSQ